jgi:hypothetical protein
MRSLLLTVSVLFFLNGCGVAIVPQATATARVNLADHSISETKSGITITAQIRDQEVAPFLIDNNLASFHLTLANHTDRQVTLPLESFLLVDNEGTQYRPVEPERIREMIKQGSPYLIPYPYVGYYYLEDIEKAGAARGFDSALPFYAENHPQDTLAEAFPAGVIVPGARIAGSLFFMVDLLTKQSVELRGYLPETSLSEPADFVLPFSIEKK